MREARWERRPRSGLGSGGGRPRRHLTVLADGVAHCARHAYCVPRRGLRVGRVRLAADDASSLPRSHRGHAGVQGITPGTDKPMGLNLGGRHILVTFPSGVAIFSVHGSLGDGSSVAGDETVREVAVRRTGRWRSTRSRFAEAVKFGLTVDSTPPATRSRSNRQAYRGNCRTGISSSRA